MEIETSGSRLYKLRKAEGWTQLELSNRAGVTRSSIAQWERDISKPSGEGLVKVCKALKTTERYVLTGAGSKAAEQILAGNKLPFLEAAEDSVVVNHNKVAGVPDGVLESLGITEDGAQDFVWAIVPSESMGKMLPKGSQAGIDTSNCRAEQGEIFAVDHLGSLKFCWIDKIRDGLRLRYSNSEQFPAEEFVGDELRDIKILGCVFWFSVFLKSPF